MVTAHPSHSWLQAVEQHVSHDQGREVLEKEKMVETSPVSVAHALLAAEQPPQSVKISCKHTLVPSIIELSISIVKFFASGLMVTFEVLYELQQKFAIRCGATLLGVMAFSP